MPQLDKPCPNCAHGRHSLCFATVKGYSCPCDTCATVEQDALNDLMFGIEDDDSY